MHYVGLDVHKKTISYCIKLVDGQIVEQGTVSTNKKELATWANTLPPSYIIDMEATMFTGWIYDFLQPCSDYRKLNPLENRDQQKQYLPAYYTFQALPDLGRH